MAVSEPTVKYSHDLNCKKCGGTGLVKFNEFQDPPNTKVNWMCLDMKMCPLCTYQATTKEQINGRI